MTRYQNLPNKGHCSAAFYGAPRLVSLGLFSSASRKQQITRSNPKGRAWKKAGNRESREAEVCLFENLPVLANAKSFTVPLLAHPGTSMFVDLS